MLLFGYSLWVSFGEEDCFVFLVLGVLWLYWVFFCLGKNLKLDESGGERIWKDLGGREEYDQYVFRFKNCFK